MKAKIIVFSFLLLLPGLKVLAQEAGVKIEPSIIEIGVDPGQAINYQIRVTNLSKTNNVLYFVKKDIESVDDKGRPIFSNVSVETGFELSSWIKADSSPLEFYPLETKTVPFSIIVPSNASPGAHFGSVLFASHPSLPEKTGIGIGYQVGSLVIVKVSGEAREEARIREFKTDRWVYFSSPTRFSIKVENEGNTLLKPRGPLEISDFSGNKIETLIANNEGSPIVPRSTRAFEITWEYEEPRVGPHRALVSLSYGDTGKKTISESVSFWILPLGVIAPIVVPVVLGGLLLAVSVKLYIRRQFKKLNLPAPPRNQFRSASPTIGILLTAIFFAFLFLIFIFLTFI